MKKQYRSSSSTDPASAAAIRFVANMDFHSQTLNTIGMQPHTIDSPAIPVSFWLMAKEAIGITAQRLKLSGAGMNQRPEARLAITLPTKAHNSENLFSEGVQRDSILHNYPYLSSAEIYTKNMDDHTRDPSYCKRHGSTLPLAAQQMLCRSRIAAHHGSMREEAQESAMQEARRR